MPTDPPLDAPAAPPPRAAGAETGELEGSELHATSVARIPAPATADAIAVTSVRASYRASTCG